MIRLNFQVAAMATLLVLSACAHSTKSPPEAKSLNPDPIAKASGADGRFAGLGIDIDLKEYKLSNGLTVLLLEDHTVPLIAYQTWFRVGSVDEAPGKTGLAHFFEHLMFKGTEKYGPKQFFLQLEARGGEVNAFTTRDYTVYHQVFVPSLLDKVIDMESDRLRGLKLTQEVLDTERQVVLEERRLSVDNEPGGKLQEAIWQLAYQRHPYRNPIIGYPQDLMRIKLEDLQTFYDEHYQPPNAALVVVGDFQADVVLAQIKKHYGEIPRESRPKRISYREPEQNAEKRLVIEDSIASERLVQAYRTTAADEPDTHALDVLSTILFEGQSSRAWRRIVEDRDIAFGVSGSNFTPTFPGLFLVTVGMKGKHVASEAETELDAVIREVQEKGVTPDEIATAIRQLTVQVVDGVRTAHGMATMIGTVYTVFGRTRSLDRDLVKYLQVTANDVKRVANQYLLPNRRSVATLIPKPIPSKPLGSRLDDSR